MSGFPDGLTNGPSKSEHSDKDAQIWERAWTIEEMKQNSNNWSLAADAGLFLCLQDFSQRMLSKTHEIEKQLDGLIRDAKATDSCLHSVFNDFLMLSNTQFIENRVYDEEVEDSAVKAEAPEKQHEQEKTREQKEAELIPKMQEAVNYGLKVLESAFEHLDIKAGNSDSEDEEVPDRVDTILEPKDLYVDRPLPYLIGSQAFMEQDDVGLGDLSSDEMSVDSDRDSVIESEDGKDAVHSDEDYNPGEDGTPEMLKKKSSMLSYDDDDDEEDEDSDIFGDSDKDDVEEETRSTHQASFADELAARIKGEPISKPDADRASLSSKKKSKNRKESKPPKPEADEDGDDMFKPPKMEYEDFTPFGARSGLFSGGRGLFDDDNEGDLFSEAPKAPAAEERPHQSMKTTMPSTDSTKSGKKIPAGGVSIFPENNLFGSSNDTKPEESKENGTSVTKPAPPAGGLFDDEDEDDFFSGGTGRTPVPAAKEKPKAKKALDLFDDEEDDGDLFSPGKSSTAPSKKEGEERPAKPSDKKMPAGAVSLFGPGTRNLLSEGLRKRPPPTSEESERSEENGLAPEVEKPSPKPPQKSQSSGLFSDDEDTQNGVVPEVEKPSSKPPQTPQSRGLFSDDEDGQIFSSVPKSQSKPETLSQNKSKKTAASLFDDEEEEDLFASAAKSKPKAHQAKASTPQASKTLSSLFSDDEDQWLISKSTEKSETNSGMKSSVSAPSSLPSVKAPQESSLFDNEDDDLFAPPKESSQKKSQRVALLFEDEDEDDKGSLFGIKPAASPAPKTSPTPSKSPALDTAEDKPPDLAEPVETISEPVPPSPPERDSQAGKKKPAGAVSLFGGIDVFASKHSQSLAERPDGGSSATVNVKKEEKREEKPKAKTVSLFDDYEEDEADWNDSIFTPPEPAKNTLKSTEERAQAQSTGVFQDEELLFSQTQQKDNDPDVDLFAASGKNTSSKPSSAAVKPAAPSLFSDDDEDDLFSSVKPKAQPPKIAEKPSKPVEKAPLASPEPSSESQKPTANAVKPKDPSSRIGKLQASLVINPSALLPGATPSLPSSASGLGGASSSSGVSSSSLSPSPVTTPLELPRDTDGGVGFDAPAQVSTLQSAHKGRVKGSAQRRPQSRAARQHAQKSVEDTSDAVFTDGPRSSVSDLGLPPSKTSNHAPLKPSPPPTFPSEASTRPSALTLPVSTNKTDSSDKESHKSKVALPIPDEEDIFGSDNFMGETITTSKPPSTNLKKESTPLARNDAEAPKDKTDPPSIFDDGTDDLFKKVKIHKSKKPKPAVFLEDADDDDLFGVGNSSTLSSTSSKDLKSSNSFPKQEIFQDEVDPVPKGQNKHKEKKFDASLFDDNIDIFADLSDTFKPKQKSKTKGETKSIFDDDMDDIFSTSTVKPVAKAPQKQKKASPAPESSVPAETVDIFDDPLNALGGN